MADVETATLLRVEVVNRQPNRLETQPLGGRGVEPELVLMDLRGRAVLGGLEIDELDLPLSPTVSAKHEVDASADPRCRERHFEGHLGLNGAAQLGSVTSEVGLDSTPAAVRIHSASS